MILVFVSERANRYFDTTSDLQDNDDSNTTTNSKKFHSVIYHEKHLVDPFHHSKKGEDYWYFRLKVSGIRTHCPKIDNKWY